MEWARTMDLTYRVILHPDDGGYAVEVPALPGCFTQGATVEQALEHVHEAIEVHIAGLRKTGDPVPPSDVIETDEEIDVPVTVTVAA